MTGRTRLGLAAGAVALALIGTTAPVLVPRAEAAATADAPRSATQDDKVRAAQEIGIVASPDLLILTDRNFVFALWQRATGTEVRASAQLAYAGVEAEQTQWIKTGVHDANARDQARILRDDAVARAAREAKQRAALVNNMTPSPILLIQSDREFAFAMWENASGPKLKLAALAAYQGDAAAQQDFILTGIFTARAADQKDTIDADEDATEAEKVARAARDARVRAAAVVAVVPTEGQLVEPDVNFVLDLWQAAKAGTEVRAAAERALRTMDDVQLRAYVGTGIHSANLQDWFTWIRKKGEADRRLLFELRTRAEQSRVHPALVAGANTAMAGTDDDVDRFLRLGQYEDAVLVQSVRSQSPGAAGWYLRGLTDAFVGAGSGADTAWRVVPGKADSTCHSFESVAHPEYYLRQQGLRVVLAASDGTGQFHADATWCSKAGLSGAGVTLESFSAKGRFARQYTTQVWAADSGGLHPYDTPTGYAADVSWQIDAP
ncbi:AbfB domain-containing protein [Amycolatopsis sp. NPDC051758]|uniref:AbfB domain-containing protein n=1 Tax=Amycolatopsis sp. NPDC051758 TaxID=3363935 RepID=UPI0037B43492